MPTGPERDLLVRAAVVGALAGFLSGLFGVGGGILIVPGLVVVASLDQRLAHGTSLAAIVPIAAAGIAGYVLDDQVDGPVALCLAAGAVAGALVGTRALRVVPQRHLRLAFTALLVVTAVRLLFGEPDSAGRAALTVAAVAGLVLVGVASGVLAGLLGVGGGIVLVPAMVLLFSIPGVEAKGTSLLVILPTAVMGTISNARSGNTRLDLAAAVGLSGVVTAFVASRISIGLDPDLSAALFAALLLVMAVRLLLDDRREQRLGDL